MYLKKCIRFVSCFGADCTATTDLVSFPTAFSDTVISRGDDIRETSISSRDKFPSSFNTQNISSPQTQSRTKLIVNNAVITVLPSSVEEVFHIFHPIEGCSSLKSNCDYLLQPYGESNAKTTYFDHSPWLFSTGKQQEEGDRHQLDSVGGVNDSVTGWGENKCIMSEPSVDFSSCLSVSSTSMHVGGQAISTSTLVGNQWCPIKTEVTHSGNFVKIGQSENMLTCEKELERPCVPIEFSVGRNSDVLFPKQSYPSMEEFQVGCTSTTHEIRWTLLEQEQLTTYERSEKVGTVDTMFQMLPIKNQTKYFKKGNQLRVDCYNDRYALGRKNGVYPNSSKVNLSQAYASKVTAPASLGNSSPMATEEVPDTLLSLNDISSHFSLSPAQRSLILSPEQMLRPNSPLPQSCTASLPCTDKARDVRSIVPSKVVATMPITQRVFTMGSPLPIRLHEEDDAVQVLSFCVVCRAPVCTEPPTLIHHYLTHSFHYIEQSSEITGTSRVIHISDKPMTAVLHAGKHVRLQSVAKLITANIAIHKQPVAEFVPVESVRYVRPSSVTHRHRFGKLAHSVSLDLNVTESSEHKTDNLGDGCKNGDVLRAGMKCTYVEVTFRRNLEGVSAPICLSKSDSKVVFLRLDRKLRSVVVRHFMQCYGKRSRCRSLSPVNPLVNLERASRKLSPCSSEKRTCSARESITSKNSSPRFQYTHPRGASYSLLAPRPRLVRPPRQWWDHIQSGEHSSDTRRMVAWEIVPLHLTIGALINFRYHLEILVSSKDGRLGIAYTNAVALLNGMVGRDTRYVGGKVTSKGDCSQSLMVIQVHVKSTMLATFVSCSQFDISAILGLDELGLGVRGVTKRSVVSEKPIKWSTISVYTKENNDVVEYKLLHRIFAGIKRLRTIEKELLQSARLSFKVYPVESIEYLIKQITALPGKPKSYIREYLTSLVNKEVLSKKTAYGGTLAHCIRDSAYCLAARCPRAVDPYCYEAFSSLFSPILEDICRSVRSSGKRFIPTDDLTESRIPNVLRYHVAFVRNLKGFAFPPLLSTSDYLKIEEICRNAIQSWADTKGLVGSWYSLADVHDKHPALCKQLMKRGLLIQTGTLESVVGGVYRHWPLGRSMYVSPGIGQTRVDLVVQLNCDDHIRVVCVDWSGKQPSTAYRKAVNVIKWLDRRLKFCVHPTLGFLSPSPYTVGTGMQVSALIKLVHLSKHQNELEALCQKLNLSLRPSDESCGGSNNNVFTATFRGALGNPKTSLASMFMYSLMYLQNADARYMME